MNKNLKKVNKMNTLFKYIKNKKGNSLAEFAVTAAMMATLATTAAPRFAGVGETAKQNQTRANLDKIAKMTHQFYMDKMAMESSTNPMGEGQGRVPGQERYDTQVGGYDRLSLIDDVMNRFDKWDGTDGSEWRSIFGLERANPDYVSEYKFTDDLTGRVGYTEWEAYMSKEEGPIVSPYQQGHYIYTVIPGGYKEVQLPDSEEWERIKCNECGPIMVIADAYNPSKYWIVKSFN